MGAPKYLNQLITKVKKYLDNNTLILGDFNLALSTLDRSLSTTSPKKKRALNDTLDQMDFTEIYRTLHPNSTEYTFFSSDMELSPEETTYWVTNRVCTDIK